MAPFVGVFSSEHLHAIRVHTAVLINLTWRELSTGRTVGPTEVGVMLRLPKGVIVIFITMVVWIDIVVVVVTRAIAPTIIILHCGVVTRAYAVQGIGEKLNRESLHHKGVKVRCHHTSLFEVVLVAVQGECVFNIKNRREDDVEVIG